MLDNIRSEYLQDIFHILFCMNVQIDRLGKIQAEDTHDGLCVDDVSSGYKIEIIVELGDVIY